MIIEANRCEEFGDLGGTASASFSPLTGRLFEAEHLDSAVLPEVMIERERTRDPASVEHGERNGVAQRPVLVDVSRESLFSALLFGG